MAETVWITGAATGIGRAMALRFAQAGYSVAIGCNAHRTQGEALAAALRSQGHNALCCPADLTDQAQVLTAAETIRRHMGRPLILINNAAVDRQALFTQVDKVEWDQLFDVNVGGAFRCIQAVLPAMLERKSGCILNVSSIWGQAGASMEVAYSASKAALIGMTQALARELGPSGVRVNCLAPGVIDTPMNAALSRETLEDLAQATPLGRLGSPQEVAAAALFLCSPDASFITGQTLGVNGGFL